jgi:AcrR family transcriptional regulator
MKNGQKEDRRVRKTKKALRDCLAILLAEKSIQSITVRELTDKADVHRSTFYANFADIYDLYKHIEETLLNDLNDIFVGTHNFDAAECTILLLQYVSDNREISRLVLGNNASDSFFNKIFALFNDACISYRQKAYGTVAPSDALEVYTQFLFYGYLGVIKQWVISDFARTKDELVAIISDVDKNFERFVRSKFI